MTISKGFGLFFLIFYRLEINSEVTRIFKNICILDCLPGSDGSMFSDSYQYYLHCKKHTKVNFGFDGFFF